MKPKDIKSLIDVIQTAVAEYCYDYSDPDFEITLSITAEDGWAKAEEQQ